AFFYRLFPGDHRVDVVRDLQTADVVEVSETEFFRFAHERFAEQCELGDVVGEGGEALRIFSSGDDFGFLLGVHSQAAQGETERHVGSRAQSVDAADLAFELFDGGDAAQRYD